MTTSDTPSIENVSLSDPLVFLRSEAPVCWGTAKARFPGFWAGTKYEDILAVSRDTATFSSAHGIVLSIDPEHPTAAAGPGMMLITMDPPRHVRLRRLVNKGFTPRA